MTIQVFILGALLFVLVSFARLFSISHWTRACRLTLRGFCSTTRCRLTIDDARLILWSLYFCASAFSVRRRLLHDARAWLFHLYATDSRARRRRTFCLPIPA